MASQLAGAKGCEQPFDRLKSNIQFGEQHALHVLAEHVQPCAGRDLRRVSGASAAVSDACSAWRKRSKCLSSNAGTVASRLRSRALSARSMTASTAASRAMAGVLAASMRPQTAAQECRWRSPSPAAWRDSAGERPRNRPRPYSAGAFAAPRRLATGAAPSSAMACASAVRTRAHSFSSTLPKARAPAATAADCRSAPTTAQSRRSSQAIGSAGPRAIVWIREHRRPSGAQASERASGR